MSGEKPKDVSFPIKGLAMGGSILVGSLVMVGLVGAGKYIMENGWQDFHDRFLDFGGHDGGYPNHPDVYEPDEVFAPPDIDLLDPTTYSAEVEYFHRHLQMINELIARYEHLGATGTVQYKELIAARSYYERIFSQLDSLQLDMQYLRNHPDDSRTKDRILMALEHISGRNSESMQYAMDEYRDAKQFIDQASPGDTLKNGHWVKMKDVIETKQTPGQPTPENNYPTSTSGPYGVYAQGAGDIHETTGSNDSYPGHRPGAHGDGRAVDFVPNNHDFSPRNIARLIDPRRIPPGATVIYEQNYPGGLEQLELDTAEILAQNGAFGIHVPGQHDAAYEAALRYVRSHMMYNPSANGPHFHFQTSRENREGTLRGGPADIGR